MQTLSNPIVSLHGSGVVFLFFPPLPYANVNFNVVCAGLLHLEVSTL